MSKILKGPAMVTYQCPATGKVFDGDEILIPTRVSRNYDDWSEQKSPVHMGLKICPEVQTQINKGFVCLVVIDPDKSDMEGVGKEVPIDQMGGMYRTGELAYLKIEAAKRVFNIDVQEIMFIDKEAIEKIKNLQGESDE